MSKRKNGLTKLWSCVNNFMKKLLEIMVLVLMFSLFTSHSFAEIKYKTYKKLPCKFNGVKLVSSAVPYEDPKVKKNRCYLL